jgi:hypothetical protein
MIPGPVIRAAGGPLIIFALLVATSLSLIPKASGSFCRLSLRTTSCSSMGVSCRHQLLLAQNQQADSHENDDDDDENQVAYRNRSLNWTNKYRHLIPYEIARRLVMDMGFSCKSDWDEYIADGKKYHGPYLPSHPDEMYKDDWVSWDDFLSLMRPYDETRDIARNVLKLQTLDEYTNFVLENPKRAQGLRIPFKPHIVYRNQGWQSEDEFFGTME